MNLSIRKYYWKFWDYKLEYFTPIKSKQEIKGAVKHGKCCFLRIQVSINLAQAEVRIPTLHFSTFKMHEL